MKRKRKKKNIVKIISKEVKELVKLESLKTIKVSGGVVKGMELLIEFYEKKKGE